MTIKTVSTNEGELLDDYLGTAVFVRTVTFAFTGRLVAHDDTHLRLEDAAWIADTGRFADFADGTAEPSEVEPYPAGTLVSKGSIIDIAPYPGELPREQK